MDEIFDRNALVDSEVLARLSQRDNRTSALQLAAHLSALGLALWLTVSLSGTLWGSVAMIALAILIGTLFAPFHECTHGTAFASRTLNRMGAALTGMLFGVPASSYRSFHFQHHRYTQDPERDPEIATNPELLTPWPATAGLWLAKLSGAMLLGPKLIAFVICWIPGLRTRFHGQPYVMRAQAQVSSILWIGVTIAAVTGVTGAGSVLGAFLLSHTVQGLWLTTEHTGRPVSGTILERTRTIRSNALVRRLVWNMNYHGEHHGWPAVPWHALPKLNAHLGARVDTHPGYLGVYRRAFRGEKV